jgi:hypothetical protein
MLLFPVLRVMPLHLWTPSLSIASYQLFSELLQGQPFLFSLLLTEIKAKHQSGFATWYNNKQIQNHC